MKYTADRAIKGERTPWGGRGKSNTESAGRKSRESGKAQESGGDGCDEI